MTGIKVAAPHVEQTSARAAAFGRLWRSTSVLATSLGLASAATGVAAAQAPTTQAPTTQAPANASADKVQEIIVTAQKRAENLQDVPLAVEAITAAQAVNQGLTGTAALTAAVPGLVITNPANVGNPYLRGVGSALFDPSSEQSVAMYIDGVYIAAPESNIFSFNNIQQIEVLKGPQGTLFGRNATGGVIQITTKDPSVTPHADLSVGYANYGDVTATAYVTGGLFPGVSADFAARYENQTDGYGKDLTTGAKTFQQAIGDYDLRGKLMLRPTDTTKIMVSVDYSHSVSTNAYQKPQGATSPIDGSGYPGPYNTYSDFNDRNTVDTGGASIKIDQDLGQLHLMDILAYRRTTVDYVLDDDVTAVPAADIILKPKTHNWSEELQLSGPSQAWLKWIVGAYYFNSSAGYDPVTLDGFEQLADRQTAVSYAAFGQATATILPRTDLTLGARYSTEKQDYTLTYPAPLAESQSFSRVTYRAALDYHFTRDVSAYASFNTGFKTGGFNLLLPGNSFKPETLDAYEVGVKSELFERKLRLNVDAFYYDDSNVQILNTFLGGTVTSNAAAAVIKGLEGDFEAVPIEHLKISGGLSLQTGKYTSYPNAGIVNAQGVALPTADLSGNKTLITPPVTGDLNVSYKWSTAKGDVQPSVTVVYNNGFFWQADNRLRQPAYTLLNASLLWTDPTGRYDIRLWAKNLTDSVYYVARLGAAGLGDVQEQAAPRTYGVTLSAHF